MRTSRRMLLTGSAKVIAALFVLPVEGWSAAGNSVRFTPEQFGAKGDGVHNDSAAMAALAKAVNANGGGIVVFRPVTYLVGAQTPGSPTGYSFEPSPLLEFSGCTKPLIIRGNGARLRCADGLRYGVFTAEGAPAHPPMPYLGPGGATPYRHMIRISDCSGSVEVADLTLDGNVKGLLVGGQWGDTGWQIPAIGLGLFNNRGAELIRNVHSHHHAQDGFIIDGVDEAVARPVARRLIAVRCEYNGRQGCSIVGGRGYRFERCAFNHTGAAGIASAPGAGVDIEAENKKNRDFSFIDCEFVNNNGCGLVADSGDSEGATFTRCRFVGSNSWSAWAYKPRFRFEGCTFAGPIVHPFESEDPELVGRFVDCLFTDDPSLSPTGRLYGGVNPDRPLADLGEMHNPLFERCRFQATHGATLPWSRRAVYVDCSMDQTSPAKSYPIGHFRGRNVINGHAELRGSRIEGVLIVNGQRFS